MNKLLILSALSIALLGGSAYAQTDAAGSGSVSGSGGVSVGGGNADAGAAAGATGSGSATIGDTSATGSVSGSASGSANAGSDSGFMDGLGDSADGFFGGDDNNELRSDDEITASFAAMTDDERNQLKTSCVDVAANTAGYSKTVVDLCAKVDAMNM